MKKIFCLLCLALSVSANAQVAINADGSSPDNSAMLDVKSETKGMLFPRMTLAQRNGISSPATGLTVYQTDNIPGIYLNSGTSGSPIWVMAGSGSSWSLTGNSGTSPTSNFIGTTDNVPLTFKVNNETAGKIDHLLCNTSLGYQALNANTSGLNNTAFGYHALFSNTTGNSNTADGLNALYFNTTGIENTAHGMNALFNNTTGSANTANGLGTLYYNTSGVCNTAHGIYALFNNTTGNYNTATGLSALFLNTTGNNNTATGVAALYENTIGTKNTATGHSALSTNSTGSFNTADGSTALNYNTTGEYNTATGSGSLFSNTSGNFNTADGIASLYFNTTGYENTALGGFSLYNNTTGYENTAIGNHALYSNTTGIYNTATGWQSLLTNTTGGYNTANGFWALSFNTSGYRNTSTGFRSLTYNSTGYYNTANGVDALMWNSEGFQNTALGAHSLYNNTFGAYNTAVGYNTGPSSEVLYNTTCIGIDATATGDGMVRIGNTYVGSIGGYQNWSNISDSRFKENVSEDVPGLSFISQLRPVTYQLNREKIDEFTGVNDRRNMIKEEEPGAEFLTGDKYSPVTTGFLAQEVEAAAKSIGFIFSGVDMPKNENDMYGLRYAEFVVPLVKAVQEQQQQIEDLKAENDALEERLMAIENKLTGK